MYATNWSDLCYPRVCGLLSENPSRLGQAMHNAGYRALDLSFSYHAFKTRDTSLAMLALRELGFRGLSLTIPHKEPAVELVDELSKEALSIGAINTAVNYGGRVVGYNTDLSGITEALKEAGFKGEGKTALVYGAGGAARAALFALSQLGLEEVFLSNRTEERAKKLAADFAASFAPLEKLSSLAGSIDLIINATPAGVPFDLSGLSSKHLVFDMVTHQTELLRAAKEKGAKTVPGLRMLLYQALEQFRLFTENEPPRSVMEQALNSASQE